MCETCEKAYEHAKKCMDVWQREFEWLYHRNAQMATEASARASAYRSMARVLRPK
jgi:hypothetical protein